jgi:hypothetical protein
MKWFFQHESPLYCKEDIINMGESEKQNCFTIVNGPLIVSSFSPSTNYLTLYNLYILVKHLKSSIRRQSVHSMSWNLIFKRLEQLYQGFFHCTLWSTLRNLVYLLLLLSRKEIVCDRERSVVPSQYNKLYFSWLFVKSLSHWRSIDPTPIVLRLRSAWTTIKGSF